MSGGRGTTVLVSGGAGYVGSHAAAALAGAGYRPVVIDDLSGGCREAVPVGVEFIQGDAGDRDAVEAVVAKRRIRAAVHLAGRAGGGRAGRYRLGGMRRRAGRSRRPALRAGCSAWC